MTLSNDRNMTGKARQGSDPSHEDSKDKLDARLDHGIKESFPGSDPVSVKVSKYAPGDDPNDQPDARRLSTSVLARLRAI